MYQTLMHAVKLLDAKQFELWNEEGSHSPAWEMVLHARNHIQAQAKAALREEN